jgi:hypothetical protein
MRWRTGLLVVTLLCMASLAVAQFRRFGGRAYSARGLQYATLDDFDGSFQFCRVVFNQSSNGDGGGWAVDFPRADENLSIRLSELTKTPVSIGPDEVPNHVLIHLRQAELFRCPFIMMTEVGSIFISDEEAANLRKYLLKGGFVWADDFWGEWAWQVFESQIRKVLPSGAFPIVDLPLDHPIFTSLMPVRRIPQIPSINFWGGVTGHTSERGAESATPHARAIVDDHGRIMIFITHNTDIGDSFEREGDDHRYFLEFSVEGYALGVNVLLYAMTH